MYISVKCVKINQLNQNLPYLKLFSLSANFDLRRLDYIRISHIGTYTEYIHIYVKTILLCNSHRNLDIGD